MHVVRVMIEDGLGHDAPFEWSGSTASLRHVGWAQLAEGGRPTISQANGWWACSLELGPPTPLKLSFFKLSRSDLVGWSGGPVLRNGVIAMDLPKIFEPFVRESATSVIARGILENVLPPEEMDALFVEHAVRQYEDELLFSTLLSRGIDGGRYAEVDQLQLSQHSRTRAGVRPGSMTSSRKRKRKSLKPWCGKRQPVRGHRQVAGPGKHAAVADAEHQDSRGQSFGRHRASARRNAAFE